MPADNGVPGDRATATRPLQCNMKAASGRDNIPQAEEKYRECIMARNASRRSQDIYSITYGEWLSPLADTTRQTPDAILRVWHSDIWPGR